MTHCLLLAHGPDPARNLLADWLAPHMTVETVTWPLTEKPDCDLMLSYRYHWPVKGDWLAPLAINFHPGPPERPGVGSTDFALAEGATHFGVTCHHMVAAVDAGPIIEVRRFPIRPHETLRTLTERTHAHLLVLADAVLGAIIAGRPLPARSFGWSGRTRTRKELDELFARSL